VRPNNFCWRDSSIRASYKLLHIIKLVCPQIPASLATALYYTVVCLDCQQKFVNDYSKTNSSTKIPKTEFLFRVFDPLTERSNSTYGVPFTIPLSCASDPSPTARPT
jgi:hypothetical protein